MQQEKQIISNKTSKAQEHQIAQAAENGLFVTRTTIAKVKPERSKWSVLKITFQIHDLDREKEEGKKPQACFSPQFCSPAS